ncbi:hypothetical protein CPB83DRAFT_857796 [Crepidotus variabilis]|uniref:Uncharacterized protein n=1 Tax=Crepidotus variabilis TaxID=179855 RepID=A0A9P6EC80_9AGAR|nr:hypothetical protein CPB83DRAFT_857796 [Crepidotus variabilis]
MHSFIPSLSFGFFVLSGLIVGSADALPGSSGKLAQLEVNLANIAHVRQPSRRHGAYNARALRTRSISSKNESFESEANLLYPGRRAAGAHFTFYVTGLGACGGYNNPGDAVVALNAQQWEGGKYCNAQITITVNGKSVGATIVDRCEGCGPNNLDLSAGLFSNWAPAGPGGGTLDGSWEFGSVAAPPPPPPSPSPTLTPNPTPKPTPSTTSSISSSSTMSETTSASTSASTSSVSGTASSVQASTPSPLSWDNGNLQQLNLAFMAVGGVLEASRVV